MLLAAMIDVPRQPPSQRGDALTPRQTTIVRLRVLGGMPPSEIARMLKVSKSAVSHRLREAKDRLVELKLMGTADDWSDVAEMLKGLLR